MKIRRFVGKRRRREGQRLIAAMCGRHLDAFEQQTVLIHCGLRPNGQRFAPKKPWSQLPASLLNKMRDPGFPKVTHYITEQELLELHKAMYEPGGGRA